MNEQLAALVLLSPLAAAASVGLPRLLGLRLGETLTAIIVIGANAVSLAALLGLIGIRWTRDLGEPVDLGTWWSSGSYSVDIGFATDPLALALALLSLVLSLLSMRFSMDYMHRAPGFERFFALLALFSFAMLLLVTSTNALSAFIGWEIAGLCSYLLIAFFYDRATAAGNALRAFLANRVGDAGFLLGICFAFIWLGGTDWAEIGAAGITLGSTPALLLALCFLLAAMAKSGLVPFSPWLGRAMEGPTPSSALFYAGVMVHAGVFLILRLEPLLETSAIAMAALVLIGLATALYGFFCGLVQTDTKSTLVFAVSTQIGLMILVCGLGGWTLALVHLCAHAILRTQQFLTAPSILHEVAGLPSAAVSPRLAGNRFAYAACLHRWWLDEAGDAVATAPLRRLAKDLDSLDTLIVDRAMGLPAPAVRALSSLAQWEERHVGPPLLAEQAARGIDRAPGLAGKLAEWSAAAFHALEEVVVLRGVGQGLVRGGRLAGNVLLRVEHYLGQPRLLFVLVVLVLLVAAA